MWLSLCPENYKQKHVIKNSMSGGAGKVAGQVEACMEAWKPEFDPQIQSQKVKEENWRMQVVIWLTHTHTLNK